ncbi:hypothetical protein [Phenylobacterium sp.]|uniref:hypothetical protein n=1 Tax=Phenylobacterium sp. TaxID=1871053 RepID=UPI002731E97E|nr:hypothetical protein [Phenylobacterium sp.]MDP1873699.1 hypothetical protein [Phenylobacterium sp.]
MPIQRDDPRFDVVLDADAPDFAERLVAAIGVEPGETIEIVTPQFERTDGLSPVAPDFDFSSLPSLPEASIRALGCMAWDEPDTEGQVLWLYPAEWYAHIPEGHMIVDINGELERFQRGVTDDDMRFGVLAFGFLRKADPSS